MKANKKGIPHVLGALRYSLAGLRVASHETAIQHELILGIGNCLGIVLLQISLTQALYLSSLWMILLVTELINTALETLVDLVSPDYHKLAGQAKDLGSAAVFLMLLLFLANWGIVIVQEVIK